MLIEFSDAIKKAMAMAEVHDLELIQRARQSRSLAGGGMAVGTAVSAKVGTQNPCGDSRAG